MVLNIKEDLIMAKMITKGDFSIKAGPFKGSFDSLREFKCPDWFKNAKFGIWSHWGPQSVPMFGDWYARQMYEEGSEQYRYPVSYTHLRAHETDSYLVCRLL